MATITKRAISERIAKRTGQTQVVTKDIVQIFLNTVVEELAKGNKLEFRDFGIFEVVQRRSRSGRNPRTGEKVFVPAKRVVSFKMGRRMKSVVAGATDSAAAPQPPAQVGPAQPQASDAQQAPQTPTSAPAPDPQQAPIPSEGLGNP